MLPCFSQTAAVLLVVGALTACGANLPGSGPTTSEVTAAAAPIASGETRFALVDVDLGVVAKLESWTAASMQGTFGRQPAFSTPTIGVGDSVEVMIWEAAGGALFSASDQSGSGSRSAVIPAQAVGAGGAITVPYAGRVTVAGRTSQQVEQAIMQALTGKAIEPQALVTVTKNIANTVTVVGDVTGGARVPLTTRGDRILDIVASAGGTQAPAHETFVTLVRDGRSVRIPMQAILNDPTENVYVRPGDVITLAREVQTFTAAGATGKNAVVAFDGLGITLDQAIARAGGLMDNRADPAGVFVIRYERPEEYDRLGLKRPHGGTIAQVPVVYRVNMAETSGFFLAQRFPVRNKDIVYVSNAPATELQKAIDIMLPFFGAGTTTVSAGSTVKASASTPK